MVTDGITDKILCRISDSGSWAIINRAGIYRSTAADNTVGELITAAVGTNNVYDLDMDKANGHWIGSSSQSTRVFTVGPAGQTQQIAAISSNPMNGSASPRRIVKINSSGTWMIMTMSGLWRKSEVSSVQVLTNPANTNINGNPLYWSLDMNEQGDWVMINSKGTF